MWKLVDEDPFSNGTDYMLFEAHNCDRCYKSSEPRDKGMRYTNSTKDNMPRCSIQRDIVMRIFCDEPIKRHTVEICADFTLHGTLCPYLKTERPPKHGVRNYRGQLKLGL